MKKIIFFFLGAIVFFGLAGAVAAAPDVNSFAQNVAGKAGYDTAGVTDTSLSKTVGGLISAVLGLVGVIFLVLTVYAGFLWMTAGGNEDNVAKAKKILTSSVVGLVIVAAAYGITALVMHFVFNASAPEGNITGGNEDFVERKQGCCVLDNKCWNFASVDQCTGTWYPDIQCNTIQQSYQDVSCTPQN